MLLIALMAGIFLSGRIISRNRKLSRMLDAEIEALGYTNEGPGPQGQRSKQAVQCGLSGWVVRVGCCYGAENCYDMNPCNDAQFSCDGLHYYDPE